VAGRVIVCVELAVTVAIETELLITTTVETAVVDVVDAASVNEFVEVEVACC
jgi:hypothetical protein